MSSSLPLSSLLDASTLSPMMVQWHTCKQQAPQAVLLFRLGDFYEAFYEDAHLLAKVLGLTLTKRQDIPMSGIPHHASEGYIDKLIAKGFCVALAEQLEDPKTTKGIVKREIVRIITPGTLTHSTLLSEKSNNFIISLTQAGKLLGLACLDVTTGDFWISEFSCISDLLNELCRLRPSELLTTQKFYLKYESLFQEIQQVVSLVINKQAEWHFEHQSALNFLIQHFKVYSLEGFGLQGLIAGTNAAGALLRYIQDVLSFPIHHIQDIRLLSTAQYMLLDRITQRNLELTLTHDGSRKNTLLAVLDYTQTPMGGRLIHHWIKQPLLSVAVIHQRQEAIEACLKQPVILKDLKEALIHVKDIERLVMKINTGQANPRDIKALSCSFSPIESIKQLTLNLSSSWFNEKAKGLDSLQTMTEKIDKALVEEPPIRLGEGCAFQQGFHLELDELKNLSHNSKAWIASYQTQLKEETGIKTLKVGYTKVFGYYIEVSRGQAEKMPTTFTRKQTLVNAERYISPILKSYESKILTAEERIYSIENELFRQLCQEISQYTKLIYQVAQTVAQLDCICSLAEAARLNEYCRPLMTEGKVLKIQEGRHPVIEQVYKKEKFISNDTLLNAEEHRLLVITGPNMAGKSTYLRQVALITIMAHMGSFVPAKQAEIGIVDKIFTRIGASDDLSRGQSTFMVEMTETANILNNVTSHSLVLLDEIGRGTSTYDGISIAWSVAEYLLTKENRLAKTLFATHYWELTQLEEQIFGAVNYQVAVHETENEINFLRKIVKGGTDKSYGIHVARLAGLPISVIHRSKEILTHLEDNSIRKNVFAPLLS